MSSDVVPDHPAGSGRPRVGAILLAGGESTRMGRDKGGLELPDGPLWLHVAEQLDRVSQQLIVATRADAAAARGGAGRWPVVVDEHPGEGPLVALAGALVRLSDLDRVVVCAVDVALVDVPTVAALLDSLEESGAQACAVRLEDGALAAQLFVARFSALARAVEQTLDAGRRSLRAALDRLWVYEVAPSRLPDPAVLWPCNTPEQWDRVRAHLAAREPAR